jgi:hypothetical protein
LNSPSGTGLLYAVLSFAAAGPTSMTFSSLLASAFSRSSLIQGDGVRPFLHINFSNCGYSTSFHAFVFGADVKT